MMKLPQKRKDKGMFIRIGRWNASYQYLQQFQQRQELIKYLGRLLRLVLNNQKSIQG